MVRWCVCCVAAACCFAVAAADWMVAADRLVAFVAHSNERAYEVGAAMCFARCVWRDSATEVSYKLVSDFTN